MGSAVFVVTPRDVIAVVLVAVCLVAFAVAGAWDRVDAWRARRRPGE